MYNMWYTCLAGLNLIGCELALVSYWTVSLNWNKTIYIYTRYIYMQGYEMVIHIRLSIAVAGFVEITLPRASRILGYVGTKVAHDSLPHDTQVQCDAVARLEK